ncbi:MAG TPA: MFS transporter [Streptosporangiaceae bacterium]|nr:MFS transporter [Streptosporangiaceae bacterium]
MIRPAGSYRAALRHRDFATMLTAFLIDQIGSWAYNVVLIVWVYDRTGSTAWIAATTAAGWIPRILFSPYAGVLADRFERTRTLLVSALLGLVLMAGVALVMATGGPVAVVLILAAATAAVGTVYLPASGALISETVGADDLAAANGLFGMLENLVVIVGPAVGGLLLLLGRPVAGILFNLATFAVAAGLISRLRVRSTGTAGADGERLVTQVAAGMAALRGHARARTLVAFCALGTAVYGASTVLYVPMSERFGTGADGYSYLLTAAAIGGVLGAAVASKLSAARRLPVIIFGGIGSLALPFAATALVTSPVIGFVLQVISGGGMVVVDVLALTSLQRDLPRQLLSRVIGLLETAVLSAALVASFAVAALIREFGLTTALVLVGLGFPVIAAIGIRALVRAESPPAGSRSRRLRTATAGESG